MEKYIEALFIFIASKILKTFASSFKNTFQIYVYLYAECSVNMVTKSEGVILHVKIYFARESRITVHLFSQKHRFYYSNQTLVSANFKKSEFILFGPQLLEISNACLICYYVWHKVRQVPLKYRYNTFPFGTSTGKEKYCNQNRKSTL